MRLGMRAALACLALLVVAVPAQAQIADAGPDQSVSVNATAQLNGSGSFDPDGRLITFAWSIISAPGGSTAALSSTTAVDPTLVPDLPGQYVVQLIVSNVLLSSPPDTVTITAALPIANAGLDQNVLYGDVVQLNGAGSTDPNGLPLTFTWSLTRPASSAAVLSSLTAVNPTVVTDIPGPYVAQLIVNNGFASSTPDSVTVTATVLVPSVGTWGLLAMVVLLVGCALLRLRFGANAGLSRGPASPAL